MSSSAQLNELSQQRAYELQRKDIEKQQEFIRRFKAGHAAQQGSKKAAKPASNALPQKRRRHPDPSPSSRRSTSRSTPNQRAGDDRVLQLRRK